MPWFHLCRNDWCKPGSKAQLFAFQLDLIRWRIAAMAENHHIDRNPPGSGLPRSATGSVWPFVLILLLAIGFYWKLVLTRQYIWFDHPDMAYLEIPRLAFQAREIQAGRFPLWDPHIWSGQPLIGQTQPGPLFPLNLLFFQLPLKDGYLRFGYLNWYWVILHFLAAWFAYLLGRTLQLSAAASMFGGLVFGFGGFVGNVAWLDVLNGAIMAPLVFLCLLKASDEGRRSMFHASLGGLFLGISWLSGHHEIPLLVSGAVLVTWIWLCALSRRRIIRAACFFAVAALVGSAQMLATIEFGQQSLRWVGLENAVGWKDRVPYAVATIYSLPAKGLLGLAFPGSSFADSSPYVGLLAIALAALGTAACWKQLAVRWAAGLVSISALFALGSQTPLHGILYAVMPLMDKARIPSRAVLLINLGIALLAAYGFHAVFANRGLHATKIIARLLAGAGGLIIGTTFVLTVAQKPMEEKVVLGGWICIAAAVALLGWRGGVFSQRAATVILTMLLLTDLTSGGPSTYTSRTGKDANKFVRHLEEHRDIAGYLKNLPEVPVRVQVDDQVIGANFGDWHGIDMLYGYVAGVSTNLMRHGLHTKRTQDLFGVTHFIGKEPPRDDLELVFEGQAGVKLYRNPHALPRFRVAHHVQTVISDEELLTAISNPETDLPQTAIMLKSGPELETCLGQDRIQEIRRGTDTLILEADLACRGLLIVGETLYPGWEVHVDGKREPMWEAYGVFRSVVVNQGTHRIEMRYRPWTVYLGAVLAACGVLVVFGCWLYAVLMNRSKQQFQT
jgi:hypothetical protein